MCQQSTKPAGTELQLQVLREYTEGRCARVPSKTHGDQADCLLQALVDRPDDVRRVMNFKRLARTDIKLDIPRLAKKKVLSEALSTAGGVPLNAAAASVYLLGLYTRLALTRR